MKPLFALILALMATLSPAAAQDYKVLAGDILKLEVLEDPSLDRTLLVTPDGRVALPQVGTLQVAGQSVDAIAQAIAAKIAPNFATPPTVSVSVQQLAARVASGSGSGSASAAVIDLFVIGEANKPGKLGLAPRTTVLQAFAEMGGFTKFAATKRIQLRRTDAKTGASQIFNLNYDAILAGTTTNGNVTLQDGDVIVVPQRMLFE